MAGIPITHREVTQGFITVSGHVGPNDSRSTVDWRAVATCGMTIVMLMGVGRLAEIADALIGYGMDPQTPAASIADAGMPSQHVARGSLHDIAEIGAAQGIRPPAVTVIGYSVDALHQP